MLKFQIFLLKPIFSLVTASSYTLQILFYFLLYNSVLLGRRYGFPQPSPRGFTKHAPVLQISDVSDFT